MQLSEANSPDHFLGRKKKKSKQNQTSTTGQILRIPNFWRSAIQNYNGKSNATGHSGHHHQSTNNKCRREPGGKRIPLSCLWEYTLATVSIMDSFWMPQKKTLGEIKARIWHSLTLAYILRKPLFKRRWHPNKASALLPKAETHYPKISNEGLKLKQGVVHIYSRLFLTHKTPSLNLGNYDRSSHRDGPWRIIH